MKRNPRVGTHPDLFEPRDTDVFVPFGDLSEHEFKRLRRGDFSDEEWEELPDEIAEEIYEQDPASKARVKRLVDAFVERYKWAVGPEENEAIESVADYFSEWLRAEDEHLISYGGDEAQDLIEHFVAEGWAREDVEGALTQAMMDEDNYELGTTTTNEYRSAFFKTQATPGGFYLDRSELDELLEDMFEDEIEIALEEIEDEIYKGFVDRDDLDGKYGIEKDVDCDVYVEADPDWDKLKEAVAESLSEVEKKGTPEATPISERVVYTFKDGAHVVDLLPSELAAEGDAQGICVGKPQYGYAAAVRQGKTKILSLRTQAGRPKFTIEVAMDPRTERVRQVRQVKGKANRLPSKPEEVKKLVELMQHLGVDPAGVSDLRPGLHALTTGQPMRNPPGHQHCHCGFCRRP